ncbi:hypothetical protein AYL99_04930 [Fonsecaea erecta]|uniref:Protein HRI1 n=1 Tax=Fonsecaea erecta TaxID=1367422 RepID=A0A178ZJF0_9EURO|nr:hypothetical protein AYL99_04930 [Fonsecaea erecta]OAP59928.1 hypothetical protein AYL99_04930 [Fonsecaea erecta]
MEIFGMLGERLGIIGTADKAKDKAEGAELPHWKKQFLQKPSISVRKGIAWSYTPPYEDTDTLVLTSPQSSFIDIRFPIKRQLSRPITSDPSFWAFAGTSDITFASSTGDTITMPYSAHCVWKHDIDSKGHGITDEGDLFLLPNADCIEVGMMQNPNTGKVEMYKEYWTGPPTDVASSGAALNISTPCVVAKTQASTETGVVIRIGNYCQAIMHQRTGEQGRTEAGGHSVLVERWTRSLVEPSDAAGWIQDWRSNTPCDNGVFMPCMWTCDGARKLGDEIVVQGITWKIVELVHATAANEEV